MSDVIHVAVGVIVGADQQILIARRPPGVHQGNLWEFPGGKLEPGESALTALQRELKEELDIDVVPERCFPLKKIFHQYEDRSVLLDIWRIDQFQGNPRGRENQPLAWRPVAALDPTQFPAANCAIINILKLPSVIAITGNCENKAEFLKKFSSLLNKGLELIQLRQVKLSCEDFLQWTNDALLLCRDRNVRLMINSSVEAFEQLQAQGLHLNSRRLMELDSRPVPLSTLFSASCHNLIELHKAEQMGVDFALLSPVKQTGTHPSSQALGWDRFKELASQVSIPVYALGGMIPDDLGRVRRAGGQGIAAISALW